MSSIGTALKMIRNKKNLTLEHVSDMLEAIGKKSHHTSISKYEKGYRKISPDTLFAFATVYGMTVKEIKQLADRIAASEGGKPVGSVMYRLDRAKITLAVEGNACAPEVIDGDEIRCEPVPDATAPKITRGTLAVVAAERHACETLTIGYAYPEDKRLRVAYSRPEDADLVLDWSDVRRVWIVTSICRKVADAPAHLAIEN